MTQNNKERSSSVTLALDDDLLLAFLAGDRVGGALISATNPSHNGMYFKTSGGLWLAVDDLGKGLPIRHFDSSGNEIQVESIQEAVSSSDWLYPSASDITGTSAVEIKAAVVGGINVVRKGMSIYNKHASADGYVLVKSGSTTLANVWVPHGFEKIIHYQMAGGVNEAITVTPSVAAAYVVNAGGIVVQ